SARQSALRGSRSALLCPPARRRFRPDRFRRYLRSSNFPGAKLVIGLTYRLIGAPPQPSGGATAAAFWGPPQATCADHVSFHWPEIHEPATILRLISAGVFRIKGRQGSAGGSRDVIRLENVGLKYGRGPEV